MDTKIDYLDKCINIICGCTYGCSYCWARNRVAPRLAHNCKKYGQFIPHFHEERLKLIDRIKKPSVIGLNFMGDTWDKNVLQEWRNKMFEKLVLYNLPYYLLDRNKYPLHKFVVLTKQPQNIHYKDSSIKNMDNLWVGVSIESLHLFHRWVALSQKEYIKHKIISFEPTIIYIGKDTIKASLIYMFELYGLPEWIIIGALTKSEKQMMNQSKTDATNLLIAIKELKLDIPIFVKDNCGIKNAPHEYPKEML